MNRSRPSGGDHGWRGKWHWLCVGLWVVSASAGCGRPAGVIFDPADSRWRWPPAPDAARIAYVGQISADRDLKPGRGGFKGLGEALFGKEQPRVMVSPIAVCTDGAGRIFVADSNAQSVHVFDLNTRAYAQWRPPTTPKGSARFAQPVALAWDPAGRLLVSDSVAARIFVFDAKGKYLGVFTEEALERPCGVVVDHEGGRVFVADSAAHQILVFGIDGRLVSRIGERGSGPGQFNYPTNVALDSRRRLWVSDTLNFRVQGFDAALRPAVQIGRKGDMPGYFSQPKGLAFDGEDHLYVVDANFEAVQLFDLEGRLLMSFGREGGGPGEFWLPAGIAVDQDGRIWIADSYNKRVQAFRSLREGGEP